MEHSDGIRRNRRNNVRPSMACIVPVPVTDGCIWVVVPHLRLFITSQLGLGLYLDYENNTRSLKRLSDQGVHGHCPRDGCWVHVN